MSPLKHKYAMSMKNHSLTPLRLERGNITLKCLLGTEKIKKQTKNYIKHY